jgi:purine-cytosine permease-like protein
MLQGYVMPPVGGLLITSYYYYKKLFEKESGVTFEPKIVTEKLQQKSKFVQLDNNFYYDNVVV